MKSTDLVSEIQNKIGKAVQDSELTNAELTMIIYFCGSYLNLKTIPEYAKSEGISYNGVLSRIRLNKVQQVDIFGVKMIIENN